MHSVQIYCAKTRTWIGKLIRLAIGGQYNHCAVGLDYSSVLYSFSRRFYYIWFTGVFREEDVSKYSDYRCYTLYVSDEEFDKVVSVLAEYREGLHIYNYLSAALLPLQVAVPPVGTCSAFTAGILSILIPLDKSPLLYTPMDVLNLMEVVRDEKTSFSYSNRIVACNQFSHDGL